MEQLKYPIGKFEYGKSYAQEDSKKHILIIGQFPKELKELAAKLSPDQLDMSYRPEGWTARQVIHHVADSHINAFIRVKLTLTEDKPVIKPYKEALWAELEDVKNTPIEVSLNIIESIHARWVVLLKTLSEKDLQRKYIHPEYNREFQLDEFLALYAWHGKHHYEHLNIILNAR